MREIRGEIEACLKQLELFQENFNKAAANRQERHLYCSNRNGKPSFSVATDNNGFHAPTRKSINGDRNLMEELLAVKLGEIAEKHVARDICQIRKALEGFEEFDLESIVKELPRAYKALPEEIFHNVLLGSAGWRTDACSSRAACSGNRNAASNDSAQDHAQCHAQGSRATRDGTIVPERLIIAAREGTLTSIQREEIRELQREWASLPYQQNEKNLKSKNKVTSRGLPVRSKSEVSIAEMLYHYDIPFRYDEVISIGNRTLSPDFSFLNILTGRICWEHAGMIDNRSYIEHHRYKRGLYEAADIVPWSNYIETYDNIDGSLDMRIVEAEIRNKLMKWLLLE